MISALLGVAIATVVSTLTIPENEIDYSQFICTNWEVVSPYADNQCTEPDYSRWQSSEEIGVNCLVWEDHSYVCDYGYNVEQYYTYIKFNK